MEAPSQTKSRQRSVDSGQQDFCREADIVLREYAISDKAKLAWFVLKLLGLDRRVQDISAVALAGWIGKHKEARGHEAIEELVEAGLLRHDRMNEQERSDRSLRGRYTGCSLNDPAAVNGPRRQPCHRKGEQWLPGEPWHQLDDAQTGRPVDVVRIADTGDAPCRPPDPSAGFGSKSGASSSECGEQSAGFGSKSGAFATSTSTSKPDLSGTSTSRYVVPGTKRDPSYTRSAQSAGFGPKSGACDEIGGGHDRTLGDAAAAVAERLASRPSLLTVEGLMAEFPAEPTAIDPKAPQHWAEACAIAIEEALHGGRGFTVDTLAECVRDTRTKRAAGTLRGPAWAFCRGAFQRKYRRLNIRWPKFKTKPR